MPPVGRSKDVGMPCFPPARSVHRDEDLVSYSSAQYNREALGNGTLSVSQSQRKLPIT